MKDLIRWGQEIESTKRYFIYLKNGLSIWKWPHMKPSTICLTVSAHKHEGRICYFMPVRNILLLISELKLHLQNMLYTMYSFKFYREDVFWQIGNQWRTWYIQVKLDLVTIYVILDCKFQFTIQKF